MFNYTVEMKDSNISWIGEIPENWNIYSLKHVVNEFIAGGTPKSSNDEFWDENNNGIPWVAIGDMNDGGYINSTTKSITHDGLVDKNLRILKKGTLIYSIFASLGKTSILNIDATTNQAILGLITSKKINDFYLKYYLEALKSTISSYSNENTQENLNSNIVKNMEIAMPTSLEIQENIANYLDKQTNKINKSITKNIELINLLEEKRTCLINHVVTKGLNPNVPMIESNIEWIGKIPEHWEIKRLKYNCKVNPSNKQSVSDENLKINFLPMEKVSEDGWFDLESLAPYSSISKGYTYFENEDVLVAKITPCFENGKNALVKDLKYGFGFGSTEFHVIRFKEQILPEFVYYLIKSYAFRTIGQAFMHGTAGQKRVGAEFIEDYLMVTPPLEEQKEIIRYLDNEIEKLTKAISKIQENICLLEEYKTSLIYHTVTGKITITNGV